MRVTRAVTFGFALQGSPNGWIGHAGANSAQTRRKQSVLRTLPKRHPNNSRKVRATARHPAFERSSSSRRTWLPSLLEYHRGTSTSLRCRSTPGPGTTARPARCVCGCGRTKRAVACASRRQRHRREHPSPSKVPLRGGMAQPLERAARPRRATRGHRCPFEGNGIKLS